MTDDTFFPQAFPLGHGTVWPGYGYPTMDDGDEFAHGQLTLNGYCCYPHYICTDDPESRMLYEHHGENELMMTTFMNVRNLPYSSLVM